MSANTIRGKEGVIIDSTYFLELPKAPSKITLYDSQRPGMIRYNKEWMAFEGALEFTDGSVSYRRFANLDENGKLSITQIPDSIISGMIYKGTYAPVSDDIDPPIIDAQYDNLPAPTTDNSGNYYIVRGIMDTASEHFITNNPTTSPVIFTPVNPSGEGNWIEIKYYFSQDPVTPSNNIVTNAYARLITANIPATGHEGLLSLSTDSDLTKEFTVTSSLGTDPGLIDSDWIISTGDKQQRLRQSRISINAASVLFDSSFMTGYHRPFSISAGTVQTVLDSLILDGLRRTGDAMYDKGDAGKGRFAATYGTSTEPAITFNDNPYDPLGNTGLDPTKWSDTSTGLYHRTGVTGEFSASASGKEVTRFGNTSILFFPQNPDSTGSNGESKLTEIGFRPPFISPVDNAKGEDGMLAFSPDYNTLIQKVSGKWKRISGSETIEIGNISEWIEAADGINYELTITADEPKSIQIQEKKTDGSYEPVEVENVFINLTGITIQVPMIPDLRFVGRCVIGI